MSIAIVTDTDSSLSADLAARYGIRQVPINVHFGEEAFQANVNLDDEALFARIAQGKQFPTTSAPTPGQFVTAYREAFEAGADAVICLCVSAAVSGTYNAAVTAREVLLDRDITVLDTRSLSMGQGFMAIAAAEAAEQGTSKEDVVARALNVGQRVHLFAALSTLKYLAKSGRVGHVTAGVANLLSIKPILSVQEGKLDMLERVRTRRKAWKRVLELTAEALDGRKPERLAVVHAAAPEAAQQFVAEVQEHVPGAAEAGEIVVGEFSPGLSVHAGAGLVGIVVVREG